jgi:hypothetical protein
MDWESSGSVSNAENAAHIDVERVNAWTIQLDFRATAIWATGKISGKLRKPC